MKYYSAGYTSILKHSLQKFGNMKPLTPSTCINHTFPDSWALSWVTTEEEEKKYIKDNLTKAIEDIQKYTDELFNNGIFYWPNLFANNEDLTDYISKYIDKEKAIEIGISIPESEIEKTMNALITVSFSDGEPGMLKILRNNIETTEKQYYGFDIIGIEYGGSFHSMYCNGLDKEFRSRFGVDVNTHGLLRNIEDCEKVITWTNSNDAPCEQVSWIICRIDKCT